MPTVLCDTQLQNIKNYCSGLNLKTSSQIAQKSAY